MAGRSDHRSDPPAACPGDPELTTLRGCGTGDRDHAGPRGAADRRHGRLWAVPRAAGGCVRRGAGKARRALADAADRGQSRLGAGRMRAACATCPRQAGGRSLCRGAAPSPTRTSRSAGRSGRMGSALIRAVARQAPARPVNVSPIATPAGSRRSTGARRWRRSTWRHDAGIDVHVWVDETRPRNQGSPHRLGARRPWRAAYHRRRQCRRAPDAAWRGRLPSSAPTGRRAPAMSPTRSAPI